MLLHFILVLIISVCVYCDKASVETKEIVKNNENTTEKNEEIASRDLSSQNRLIGQGLELPNDLQKQEMINQYLSKPGQENIQTGLDVGGGFPVNSGIQNMPIEPQQSNGDPRADISRNDQIRQDILNSIRGGSPPQNGLPDYKPMMTSSNSFSPSFGIGQSRYGSNSIPSYSSNSLPSTGSFKYGGSSLGNNYGGYAPSGNQATCNVSGRILFQGDKWTSPGICGLFTCSESSFRELTTTCPSLSYQEDADCFIEDQDLSQDFPRCCPKLICSSLARITQPTEEPKKYGGEYRF
uniref:Single domain-containing protein n=1 Tax=Cuerna arida TaxID=1464854 RepID=A0A1B6G965_9HEMI